MDTEVEPDNWKSEAEGVINDIKEHVTEVNISKTLESNNGYIFLNITTIESARFCVELSKNGFCVVGDSYDEVNHEKEQIYYETPYSLLNAISPQFCESFGNALLSKLSALAENSSG